MNKCVLMSVYSGDESNKFKKCLDSLQLELGELHLFLAVDGKVDRKVDLLIKPLEKHPCVSVYRFDRRLGLTTRLNQLITKALSSPQHYEFFFRLDADDHIINNRITIQENFLKYNDDVDICAGHAVDVWKDGTITSRSLPIQHEDIVNALSTRNPIKHSTVCFRRYVLEQGHKYNTYFERCQDRVLWTDLIYAGFKFHIIEDQIIKYTNDQDFISRKKDWKALKFVTLAQLYTLYKLRPKKIQPYAYFFGLIASKLLPTQLLQKVYRWAEK